MDFELQVLDLGRPKRCHHVLHAIQTVTDAMSTVGLTINAGWVDLYWAKGPQLTSGDPWPSRLDLLVQGRFVCSL